MKLEINKDSSVSDIQEQFSAHYPALKLEFYKQKPVDGMNTKESLPADNSFKKQAIISIAKDRTVEDFEKEFWDKLKIAAQVFRKSGNIWLQTTRTDDWTLDTQNTKGLGLD